MLSPGVSPRDPAVAAAVEHGVPVLGEVELFARMARAPVVAVTGTNGKSTVCAWVHAMAESEGRDAAIGGNYGPPALTLLARKPELYVVELSSFQLETTRSLRPRVAALLNVSPDHLDRHRGFGGVPRGQGPRLPRRADGGALPGRRVARRARRPSRPGRGRGSSPLPRGSPGRASTVSSSAAPGRGSRAGRSGGWKSATWRCPAGTTRSTPSRRWRSRTTSESTATRIARTLRAFPGLAHRCEPVGCDDGVRWYDDSKGTNVGATVAAVNGFEGPLVLIAGGDGKGADFRPLGRALRESAGRIRKVVLLGRDAPAIRGLIEGHVPVASAGTMADAVARAREAARPGDAVLLSPACASWDMYRDYRGTGTRLPDRVPGGREGAPGVTRALHVPAPAGPGPWRVDAGLAISAAALILIGLVMVASASVSIADGNFGAPAALLLAAVGGARGRHRVRRGGRDDRSPLLAAARHHGPPCRHRRPERGPDPRGRAGGQRGGPMARPSASSPFTPGKR